MTRVTGDMEWGEVLLDFDRRGSWSDGGGKRIQVMALWQEVMVISDRQAL